MKSFFQDIQNIKQSKAYKIALQAEKEILQLSGFKVGDEIKIEDFESEKDKKGSWIHSLVLKKEGSSIEKRKNILFLHGYLSCGATFYKLFNEVSKKYNIYALDLPGMGLSSREQFEESRSKQEIINYFTENIDEFVKSKNLEKFTLAGHSFGGYIAAHYALQNPQKIENLFLISPLGVTSRDSKELEVYEQEIEQKGTWGRKMTFRLFKYLIKNDYTLVSLSQIPFLPTSYFLNRWMSYWFPQNENEKWMWYNYLKNILELPISSDLALNKLFHPQRLTAHIPLEKILPEKKPQFPIHFIYGDRDWMCQIGAKRIVDNKIKQQPHFLTIISNSGHNINYDNPNKLAYCINNF